MEVNAEIVTFHKRAFSWKTTSLLLTLELLRKVLGQLDKYINEK